MLCNYREGSYKKRVFIVDTIDIGKYNYILPKKCMSERNIKGKMDIGERELIFNDPYTQFSDCT